MNLRVPVKCTGKKPEGNGEFSVTLLLPPSVDGQDNIRFASTKELVLTTRNKSMVEGVKKGDTLYLSIFTSDQ